MFQFIWVGTAATVGKLVSTSTIPSKQGNSNDFTAGSVGAFRRSICHEIPGRGIDTVQFWKLSSLPHSKLNVSSLQRPVTWNCLDKYLVLILGTIWNICAVCVWFIGTECWNSCRALNGLNTPHQFKCKFDLWIMKLIFPWFETYFWFVYEEICGYFFFISYTRLAQPVTHGQHVALDTASSCSCRLMKWENILWSLPWQSRDRRLRLFWKLMGCLIVETYIILLITFIKLWYQ